MDPAPKACKTGFSIFVLLVKTTVGAGVLSMPHAFMSAGYLSGPVIMLIVGIIMFKSLTVMQKATEACENSHDYQAVVQELLGNSAGLSAEVAIAVYQSLSCCAFLIIIGDAFTPWFTVIIPQHVAWLDRPLAIFVCSLPALYLCFYPRITQLACAMSFGVAVVTVISLVVITDYAYHGQSQSSSGAIAVPQEWQRSLASISVFAFGLQCHIAVPRTFSEMPHGSRSQFTLIAFFAYTFIGCVYCLVGFCGYCLFGRTVAGNVLKNYEETWMAHMLQLLNGCQAIFGYAINHYTARSGAYSLLVRLGALEAVSDAEKQMLGMSNDIPRQQRRFITVIFYLCACALAAAVDDLGSIASLIGATVGTLVIFWYPAALSFKLASGHGYIYSVILTFSGCVCFFFGLLELFT